MELTFSKSRIVYYKNYISSLVNTDTSWDKISITNFDANPTVKLRKIPGNLHNWHQVPTNTWGLYTSINALFSMYENSSHILPIKCDVSVSHCAPLAKYPGTANTTQLSFTNTIYSLIYDLHDTSFVQAETVFNDQITADTFYPSFDSAAWNDNSTVVLPVPDITFKIPNELTGSNTLDKS